MVGNHITYIYCVSSCLLFSRIFDSIEIFQKLGFGTLEVLNNHAKDKYDEKYIF